ncbi:MAG TPA: gliding motility lipoprotein GldH [Chitinophagaceae bacterium]|jgi:gliding motility-associated lipoprotein GldH|nr:gliding motility lipoprotein GldH [Chitinophagaceae bacterium]
MNQRPIKIIFLACLIALLGLCGCTKVDLFERIINVPQQEWKSGFKPVFRFTITDTTVPYQLYIILRHNNKYNYNNLWLNLYTRGPGDTFATKVAYELPLATNDKGWLGSGMDDIFEHRIALTPINNEFYFRKGGSYSFALEHIMREDPLLNVLNIGLRIEKKAL